MNDRTREALEAGIAWRKRALQGAAANAASLPTQIAKLQAQLDDIRARRCGWVEATRRSGGVEYRLDRGYGSTVSHVIELSLVAHIEHEAVEVFRAALLARLVDSGKRHIGTDDYTRGIRDGLAYAITDAQDEGTK